MLESPEETVGSLLRQYGWHLAVAESCTGGLVSHRITNVPGSSDYFLGGITAYANEVKMRLLGVSRETLETCGAVSRETALEMAQGVRLALQADVGLGITGIAGPGGGTPQKPVGLVWIALSTDRMSDAKRFLWSGDRLQVKEQSAQAALEWLVEFLHQPEVASH
jgi:PncC family amidohydrolase